jgi:hypothetical protein
VAAMECGSDWHVGNQCVGHSQLDHEGNSTVTTPLTTPGAPEGKPSDYPLRHRARSRPIPPRRIWIVEFPNHRPSVSLAGRDEASWCDAESLCR